MFNHSKRKTYKLLNYFKKTFEQGKFNEREFRKEYKYFFESMLNELKINDNEAFVFAVNNLQKFKKIVDERVKVVFDFYQLKFDVDQILGKNFNEKKLSKELNKSKFWGIEEKTKQQTSLLSDNNFDSKTTKIIDKLLDKDVAKMNNEYEQIVDAIAEHKFGKKDENNKDKINEYVKNFNVQNKKCIKDFESMKKDDAEICKKKNDFDFMKEIGHMRNVYDITYLVILARNLDYFNNNIDKNNSTMTLYWSNFQMNDFANQIAYGGKTLDNNLTSYKDFKSFNDSYKTSINDVALVEALRGLAKFKQDEVMQFYKGFYVSFFANVFNNIDAKIQPEQLLKDFEDLMKNVRHNELVDSKIFQDKTFDNGAMTKAELTKLLSDLKNTKLENLRKKSIENSENNVKVTKQNDENKKTKEIDKENSKSCNGKITKQQIQIDTLSEQITNVEKHSFSKSIKQQSIEQKTARKSDNK